MPYFLLNIVTHIYTHSTINYRQINIYKQHNKEKKNRKKRRIERKKRKIEVKGLRKNKTKNRKKRRIKRKERKIEVEGLRKNKIKNRKKKKFFPSVFSGLQRSKALTVYMR